MKTYSVLIKYDIKINEDMKMKFPIYIYEHFKAFLVNIWPKKLLKMFLGSYWTNGRLP